MVPVIALVGRPNVGKSTLFNRLTRSRDAIVGDLSGLTRDRQYGEAKWQGRTYIVIDTGGISGDEEGIDATIKKDCEKFLSLLDNSGELRRAREEIYPVLRIDVESYLKQYRRLVENYEDAQAGNVRWMFQYATQPEDVVPMIFDERFSALNDSISTVELLEDRIHGDMADYAMIRIARDEGIIGDSPFLLKIQQEKEDACKYRLPRALAMVNMLNSFMTDLQEMGTDTLSHDAQFTVERYKPVSIAILPKITP